MGETLSIPRGATDVVDEQAAAAELSPAGVKSAERVLDLLEFLSTVEDALGVTDISRRLGHPKSSTSLLLSTLEARGYLLAEPGRRFRLNPAYRGGEPSWVGGRFAQLRRIAVPLMQRLVDTVGESSMLGLLTPECQVQYLAKVISPNELRFDPDIRSLRPATLTSVGLVLIAYQRQEIIDRYLLGAELPPGNDGKPVSPLALLEQLAEIREKGYAENDSVLKEGASGVAAPVFGADGEVLAAVNLVAPTVRFNGRARELREQLLATTGAITRMLAPDPRARRAAAS